MNLDWAARLVRGVKLSAIVFLLVLPVTASDESGRANESEREKLKLLLREWVFTLREIHELTVVAFVGGVATTEDVHRARAMLLSAELEHCETKEQRLKLREDFVTDAEKWENTIAKLFREGQASRLDTLRAKAFRQEAQVGLFKVRNAN